jgi:hypothetical protein
LCQIEPETRLFCLLIVGIHENLWYKMRRELIQTTKPSAVEYCQPIRPQNQA